MFRRTDGVWNQEGDKLVGASAVGAGRAGCLCHDFRGWEQLSAGPPITPALERHGCSLGLGVWSQQAEKLTGAGAIGNARQVSAAMSGDAATAIGGSSDNSASERLGFSLLQACLAGPQRPK